MKIALDAAKFSSEEANQLRKAMATFRSRGNIEVLQDKMVGRMVGRGYDPDFAQRCFDQIKGFGEYGFPESHAASFAHLVYVSSWLKWKYPAAFACGLLNSQPMGFYAPAQIVRDAREHGVEVRAGRREPQRLGLHAGRMARFVSACGRSKGCTVKRPTGWSRARITAVRQRRGSADARRRAGACDPAAGGGRCVPLDRARSPRGAVGCAGAEAGAGPALVRCRRGARRRRGTRVPRSCRPCRSASMS